MRPPAPRPNLPEGADHAISDEIDSQAAVSSDAKKGLGFAPDFQPLFAWNGAERRRRGLA